MNIALFEDEPAFKTLIDYRIIESGHELVGHAATLEQSFNVLRKLFSNEVQIDLLLLDGNLQRTIDPVEFSFPLKDNSGQDGAYIVDTSMNAFSGYGRHAKIVMAILDQSVELNILKKRPYVLGISSSPMKSAGIAVDDEIPKQLLDTLGTTLKKIEEELS